MENKYLNLTGAVYIISKIKTLLGDKSDKGHTHSKEEIGLGNVENKSSQTIRGELTSDNVIKALGYTPPKEDTTYAVMKGATASAAGTSGLVPAPAAGDQGKYLRGDGTYGIANSGSGQNVYDEYLWINNKYEKLGTREIDLSSYIKQSDMVAITNSEIDAAFA